MEHLSLLTKSDIDMGSALRRGEHPTLRLLDSLIERGFTVHTDPRLPLREFYIPERTVMHRGRVVHPLYLWYHTPPQR